MKYFNRDLSWLGFNYRVLQEAMKSEVPLYERISFLSIYSSNLDEFFRVRYPVLASLSDMQPLDDSADAEVANEVESIVNQQLPQFGKLLTREILPELRKNKVHLYYNEEIASVHEGFAEDYFYTNILSFLQPIILDSKNEVADIENNALYFFVGLEREGERKYGVVNIPHDHLPRFVELPSVDGMHQVAFIDDVLRMNINKVFPSYKVLSCHSIKLTRNADISIADEWSDQFEEQVLDMIKKREKGAPTRLLYESGLKEEAYSFLKDYFKVIDESCMIEGGRYHNLKDLSKLPNPIGKSVKFASKPPQSHKKLSKCNSIFDAMSDSDEMLHLPYHTYNYVLRFFNEATIDPNVEEISVTLYRVASNSYITNALISAAKNGKKVTAFVELKARFDEENNLVWAKKMKVAGVKIVYSIPGIKVHVKLALVKRKEGLQSKYYSLLSTGNFNEGTARFYTDHILFTSDNNVTREVDLLFTFLKSRKNPKQYSYLKFNHLLVAGFNFVDRLTGLVDREIENKASGKEAKITIKLNNLQEKGVIKLLYKASSAGVKVDLIVRGICCLVPRVKGVSENITVRRIVGQFLEHSRVFIFHNNGQPEVFVGSADLMNRNIHRRVEVVFPIYNDQAKKEVLDIIDLQLADNTQATVLNEDGSSVAVENNGEHINSQYATYDYVGKL